MAEAVDIFSQQAANRRRSRLLVAVFIAFFAWLGFGGDYIAYEYTRGMPPGEYHHVFPWLGILLTGIGIGVAWWGWTTGPQRVLAAAGARQLVAASNDRERVLLNCVEEMSIASGLPLPRVWIIPDEDPNAFATGHDETDANVAVTEGLLATLSRDELQAVIAHELGHVRNHDVQLMTLLAGLVGAIALVADGMSRRTVRVGGGGGSRRSGGDRDRGGGGGPLLVILLVVWIISWILAPILSRVLAAWVSRGREYLADSMSAQYTRNPIALATALEKIGAATAPTKSVKQSFAHLCIADPAGRAVNSREGAVANLLATHPPLAMRISRLKAMGYQEQKRSGTFSLPTSA
ncbi:MAG TPA: M48 family metallopeptidase [Gemmatimonadaceae bacterium]|nr:M48 family metallopeptidase [Gemmatimonadaceae bacterium]